MRPQYGDSVRTSLKNVQNFAKTSKLRQNNVKMTFDTWEGRFYWVGGVTRGGPGAPPVRGFSRDLFKKRPKFYNNVEIT